MKAELTDGKTLKITAESVAEHEALTRFEGLTLKPEPAPVMQPNVCTLTAVRSNDAET